MSNTQRWIVLVGAVFVLTMIGFVAYQAGVAHGIEQSGKIVVPPAGGPYPYPYPYPYSYDGWGWHRPWGFGFFYAPLVVVFLVVAGRSLSRRRAWYGGGCGPRGTFDEWHRQAHARDTAEAAEPPPPTPAER
jgi:hypothetical protein